MIVPTSYEELANYVKTGKNVFFFTADWCGDCHYILPALPEIENQFPEQHFIEVNRDKFLEVASAWNIFGIPSFVVVENGQELGRLVNKKRKTKEEIVAFLQTI